MLYSQRKIENISDNSNVKASNVLDIVYHNHGGQNARIRDKNGNTFPLLPGQMVSLGNPTYPQKEVYDRVEFVEGAGTDPRITVYYTILNCK